MDCNVCMSPMPIVADPSQKVRNAFIIGGVVGGTLGFGTAKGLGANGGFTLVGTLLGILGGLGTVYLIIVKQEQNELERQNS